MPERSSEVADKYEPITIEGQQETGIWVHRPGSEVSQTWEPRKGKSRHLEGQTPGEGIGPLRSPSSIASGSVHSDGSSTDKNSEGKKAQAMNPVLRALHKLGSVFHRNRKEDNSSNNSEAFPSPPSKPSAEVPKEDRSPGHEGSDSESPSMVKDTAKSILKQGRIKHALSRKGSGKSKFDHEMPVSDSSDEDSVSSSPCTPTPKKEAIPIILTLSSSHGNDPADHKERVVFIGAPATGIEEPAAASEVKVEEDEGREKDERL